MVQLYGPNPQSPVPGESFSITARDGIGPYRFIYRFGEDQAVIKDQDDPKLEIDIPKMSGGQSLEIEVIDEAGESDKQTFFILDNEGV